MTLWHSNTLTLPKPEDTMYLISISPSACWPSCGPHLVFASTSPTTELMSKNIQVQIRQPVLSQLGYQWWPSNGPNGKCLPGLQDSWPVEPELHATNCLDSPEFTRTLHHLRKFDISCVTFYRGWCAHGRRNTSGWVRPQWCRQDLGGISLLESPKRMVLWPGEVDTVWPW